MSKNVENLKSKKSSKILKISQKFHRNLKRLKKSQNSPPSREAITLSSKELFTVKKSVTLFEGALP